MKNMKTKIGMPLTILACFLTFSCGSKNADKNKPVTPAKFYDEKTTVAQQEEQKDPDVMKVMEAIKQNRWVRGYETSNKKFVRFFQKFTNEKKPTEAYPTKTEFLELQIFYPGENEYVSIQDRNLNNLDSKDIISYTDKNDFTQESRFDELSSKAQQEIKKEYDRLIKEAPEKISKENEKYERIYQLQEKQEKQELERNVLDAIK